MQYPAIWCAHIFICQCDVLTTAKTYPLQTTVKPEDTNVRTRENVSYNKYLTHISTVLLTTIRVLEYERKLEQYLSEIVGFLYTILYKYICYTK